MTQSIPMPICCSIMGSTLPSNFIRVRKRYGFFPPPDEGEGRERGIDENLCLVSEVPPHPWPSPAPGGGRSVSSPCSNCCNPSPAPGGGRSVSSPCSNCCNPSPAPGGGRSEKPPLVGVPEQRRPPTSKGPTGRQEDPRIHRIVEAPDSKEPAVRSRRATQERVDLNARHTFFSSIGSTSMIGPRPGGGAE
jgi:hypothetical protein